MRPLLAITAASVFFLAGCGGSATVDNTTNTSPSSIAPLERGTTSSTTVTEAEPEAGAIDSKKELEPTESKADTSAQAKHPAGATDSARAETAPAGNPAQGDSKEQAYLESLKKAGINITGVEDQLIGAAQAECNDQDHVTVPAVAGQLIEQARTTLPHGEVIGAIASGARTEVCP